MKGPNNLRSLRKAAKYSIQELATKAEVSPATFTAIERYGYLPGQRVRQKIAMALGVAEKDIFPGEASQ